MSVKRYPNHTEFISKEYHLLHKLGQGTYATVYRAYKKDDPQKRDVAIKCMSLSSVSKAVKENIVTEIEILKKVKSEYIVQLIDFQWDCHFIYLIMEYCSGGDLSIFIKARKKLPEAIVQKFLQQIATALKVLREHNISHMDLKPQNILLSSTKDPKLKIADLGLAQYLGNQEEATSLRGSPLYMAPEILLNRHYDASVDLWSIGIILFECLFGQAPYKSETFAELEEKIKSDKPIEIPNTVNLSDDCRNLLCRLLQRVPENRITFKDFFDHSFLDLEHMPSQRSYDNGLSLIKSAVEKDESGDSAKASKLYLQGLLYLVPIVRSEPNPRKREALKARVTEYMDRVEALRLTPRSTTKEPKSLENRSDSIEFRETTLYEILSKESTLSGAFAKTHAADEQMIAGDYKKALSMYKEALSIIVPAVKECPSGPRKEVLHTEAVNWLRKGEEAKSCLAIQQLNMEEVARAVERGEDLDFLSSTLAPQCSLQ